MKIIKRWANIGKVQLADLIEYNLIREAGLEYPVMFAIFFKSDTRWRSLELVNIADTSIFIGVLPDDRVAVVAKELKKPQYMVWRGDLEKFLNELRNATYATHSTRTIYMYLEKRYYKDVETGFKGIVSAFEEAGLGYAYDTLNLGL